MGLCASMSEEERRSRELDKQNEEDNLVDMEKIKLLLLGMCLLHVYMSLFYCLHMFSLRQELSHNKPCLVFV